MTAAVPPTAEFAPAKINLFLAVTGRRADGYHDLVSVAAPLAFGDSLSVEWGQAQGGGEVPVSEESVGAAAGASGKPCPVVLQVSFDPGFQGDGPQAGEIPAGEDNLVIQAARAFAAEYVRGEPGAAEGCLLPRSLSLHKRIPAGAGLGGGSSDAAATLRLLNARAPRPLSPERLAAVAARVGSDCPLFLAGAVPTVIRGRGERVAPLEPAAAGRLRGRRILVFKPAFGVPTAWAYGRLAARAPSAYVPPSEAEARLSAWLDKPDALPGDLLFNSMEPVVFAKFAALPALLRELSRRFGLAPRMSGSGSACYALLDAAADAAPVAAAIREAWGPSAFVLDTLIA